MYHIKANGEWWTGSAWTTRQSEAKEYEFSEGLDIIEKRFHSGIRRSKRSGAFYYDPVPVLERIGDIKEKGLTTIERITNEQNKETEKRRSELDTIIKDNQKP